MISNSICLSRRIPKQGYRWVKDKREYRFPYAGDIPQIKKQAHTSWSLVEQEGEIQVHYVYLENHLDLYCRFANLLKPSIKGTRLAIKKFSDEFGCLDWSPGMDPLRSRLPVRSPNETRKEKRLGGTPIEGWIKEILQLKRALQMWHALEGDDGSNLDDFVEEADEGFIYSDEFNSDPDSEFNRPSLESSWQQAVQKELELRIKGHLRDVSPDFGLNPNEQLFNLWFDIMPESRGDIFDEAVDDLVVAMWIQLAEATTQHREHKACLAQDCNGLVPLGSIKKNTTKYCSYACGQKSYRRSIKLAKKLYQQGKSIPEISSTLPTDSDVDTIKGWIQDLKKEEEDS